jgi:hypothetical protein
MVQRAVPEWTIVDFIHRGPWWTNRGELQRQFFQNFQLISRLLKGILNLNLMLILPLLTSVTNGLDSSLVNGMVPLKEAVKHILSIFQDCRFFQSGSPFLATQKVGI